jgi:opine dehydrogenase
VNIAVLGGGNGGYATAADLALAGHKVRLWRRSEADLAPVRRAGLITLLAEGRQGEAQLDAATTDLGDAVRGAEIVIVALPASAHEELARRLAPHVAESQIVLLTPGSFGSFVMAREIARAHGRLPLAFAETGTLPYLARRTGPASVAAPVRAVHLPVGVFPGARAARALGPIRALFPATRPCADVLDAALTNAGVVLHPPLVLLNAAAIDGGAFDVHAAGTTASARRLVDAVDAERLETRKGWGYPPPHYEQTTYYDEARAEEGLYGAGARQKLIASGLWSEVITFEHRYVAEDVVLGLSLFESAARAAGAATRAISGLLAVFGALLGRELSGHGRALESHGLGDLSRREIRALLEDGWQSSTWPRVLR